MSKVIVKKKVEFNTNAEYTIHFTIVNTVTNSYPPPNSYPTSPHIHHLTHIPRHQISTTQLTHIPRHPSYPPLNPYPSSVLHGSTSRAHHSYHILALSVPCSVSQSALFFPVSSCVFLLPICSFYWLIGVEVT
ncbi:hypothetical protein Pmani_029436 [Petrolisthes manimaculis]|uniref:Uncharacterized protein n=1 Tax=Petrolisthes manimaculis TaxID=1843537 RepID=A0AAE1P057_9EUCA|nr:hypothetical protein Pmani_029436 [Petrolisthes manimaculis]